MNYLSVSQWILRWLNPTCELCKKNPCHSRCQNFIPPKKKHYCSACGEGIYSGEEYIVNDDNEYRHCDCFYGMKDLLERLGYEIETMEEIYERNY